MGCDWRGRRLELAQRRELHGVRLVFLGGAVLQDGDHNVGKLLAIFEREDAICRGGQLKVVRVVIFAAHDLDPHLGRVEPAEQPLHGELGGLALCLLDLHPRAAVFDHKGAAGVLIARDCEPGDKTSRRRGQARAAGNEWLGAQELGLAELDRERFVALRDAVRRGGDDNLLRGRALFENDVRALGRLPVALLPHQLEIRGDINIIVDLCELERDLDAAVAARRARDDDRVAG